MKIKSLVMAVFFLLVASAVASSPAPNSPEKSSPAVIKTYLRPDLSLRSVFSSEMFPSPGTTAALAVATRTCRCSCGKPCATNADCGPGGVCAFGITCCNSGPGKEGLGAYFAAKDTLSSHKDPSHVSIYTNC